ncbi:hypothetical protein [Salisediminibacterium halotolerans]|uniref:hypothetical protein n=1 Tax=Salisediminibacterium halotolerans TaxID=517425 RepID=UPI000EB2DD16|nr:hypothetical protein [Salisediminibacterium halotolerans]RLJ75639.1 hypothetical protein BCL39_1156 [Actinophytocola xinjiangensis]RPE89493.1 hypothetical protein EDD67_0269 [Salisediminibacterium halotolerans]TWG36252.1 hypothetical protein BCL52_1153 [Salisediminibacterium halotolerans]GEL08262.1 hypothetical protein SHA02_16780 [Salisediminibacterium halotolerans]
MVIADLVRHTRETSKLKQRFKERAANMKPGTYALSPDLKLIYRVDADTIRYVSQYFGLEHERAAVSFDGRRVYLNLGNPTCKIEKKADDDGGTVYYVITSADETGKAEAKVFKFEEEEVLTLFERDHDVYKYAANDTYFRDFFQLTEVNTIDLERRICSEQFVPFMRKKDWTFAHYDKVTARLFSNYYEYAQTCGEEISVSYGNVKAKLARIGSDRAFVETAALLDTAIPELVKRTPFPHIRQHGNMHSDNILICCDDDDKIYFTGWDQSMKYLLGFDLFHWFQDKIDERSEPHKIGLIDYFHGDFDPYFDKLFRAFGLYYNEYSRKTLYFMYLTEKIYRKELAKSRPDKKRSALKHNEQIDRIKELELS